MSDKDLNSEPEGDEQAKCQPHVQDVVLENLAFHHIELFVPDVFPAVEVEHRSPDDGLAAEQRKTVAGSNVEPVVGWKPCAVLCPQDDPFDRTSPL